MTLRVFTPVAFALLLACAARAGEITDAARSVSAQISAIRVGDASEWSRIAETLGQLPGEPSEADGPSEALERAEEWAMAASRAGWEWRVVFGLSTDQETRLSRLLAARTLRVAAETERLIEAARAADETGGLRAVVSRAEAVLPLRTARALLLLAACEPDPTARRALVTAASGLLTRGIDAGAWFEAERAVLAARALAMGGAGVEALDIIRTLDRMESPPPDAERTYARAQAESLVNGPASGRGVLRAAIDRAPFVEDGRRDWFASLIAAGMHARSAIEQARRPGDAATRDSALAQALVMLEALAREADTPEEASFVIDESVRAIDAEPRLADASDFAIAIGAIRDPEGIGASDRLLRIIESGELHGPLLVSAELALLRALSVSDRPADRILVGERAVAFAGRYEGDPRIDEVLAWGVGVAAQTRDDSGDAPRVEKLLRSAIEAAPSHPAIDRWRTELASSLTKRAGGLDEAASLDLLEQAISELLRRRAHDEAPARLLVWMGERASLAGGIGRDYFNRALEHARGLASDEARRLRIRALVGLGRDAPAVAEAEPLLPDRAGDASETVCVALVRLGKSDRALEIARGLEPQRRAACAARISDAAWRETSGLIERFPEDIRADPLRAAWADAAWRAVDELDAADAGRAAWGLLIAGDAERANTLFRRASAERRADSALVRGLGESFLAIGDDAGAFAAFRELAALTEHDKRTRDYWHAQARLAEVLVRQNADGSRTDTIARLIRRLRSEPGWGEHADCASRLEKVAAMVGAAD